MIDIAGYLDRLGLDAPGPPSVEGLHAIHRAQTERLAYTSADIQLGRPAPLDPAVVVDHLVRTGRVGYCFHQNGALGALLAALGYEVRRHLGSVFTSPDAVPFEPFPNHMVLTVHGLDGDWLVDAGLGDALHEPLPLVAGAYRQGPYAFVLEPSAVGWRFRHDTAGSFLGMDFSPEVAPLGAFEHSHRELSTAPDSSFVRTFVAQRRDAGGADKLLGLTLTRVSAGGATTTELSTEDEWRSALADIFALRFDDVPRDELDALWRRVRAAQQAWKARHA